MKYLLSIIALTLLSISFLNAQNLENSTLWKIEGNGLDKASYLFGTIHITCDATLENDVKKALDETSQIVLEIDMDDPEMQTKMMKGMYMKGGKTLKDFVSDKDYQTIDSLFIKNMGMSINNMSNIKPILIAASLYPKMIDCPMQSFESELIKVAKAQGEEVKGLETLEEQMLVFEDIPYQEQINDLLRMAEDNLAKDRKNFEKILSIYGDENITAMHEMMDDDTQSYMSKYQDILLDNRNKNWISKIGNYAKDQATFFGVGAGHLAGENGVINLLRAKGYSVTAVRSE